MVGRCGVILGNNDVCLAVQNCTLLALDLGG